MTLTIPKISSFCLILFFFVSTLNIYSQEERGASDIEIQRAPFKIAFSNKTGHKIYVAVRYKNLDGDWVTKNWIVYESYEDDKEENTYAIKTYNRYVYYYARTKENSSGHKYWGGSDNYQYVDGEEVGMKEVHLSKSKFAKPQGQTQYVNFTY